MVTLTQTERPLAVTTPLGKDALLLVGFTGHEAISHLFRFYLDLIAANKTEVAFDRLLGQKMTVRLRLPDGKDRYFSGICNRLSQGERDSDVTAYQAEIVPQLWLLTRRAQSRIFQHLPVPDILKKVLDGLDVAYELQGSFPPRDYCVQYRETDFNFASRLMEEEGIYYFFKHTDGGHKLVLANTPQSHPDVPGRSKIVYETMEGGLREDDRIYSWEKYQELRSGKVTLWDHSFELPHKHVEAEKSILDSVAVGKVTHKLKVGGNDKLELYDYPGEYAQRFDGVDKGGGDQPAEVQKIFDDNKRTVEIRMQEEALPSLVIHGSSVCRQFTSGHKFTLGQHFNADGPYVLVSVEHSARQGNYQTGSGEVHYQNNFSCIPAALPYRPLRTTSRPFVQGTQTAVVVGPAGEEIFTDKYGRVKVQFHWDRLGKSNADSACWCRVATLWAGKQWGVIHIPRLGQEVVVAFEEGDPDRPIIIGSVYNAEMMPPYKLPDNKTQSGIKSRSSLKGGEANFNEFRFEDKKGEEQVFLHAEKNQAIEVEHDETHWVGNDRTKTIDRDERTEVKRDRTESVGNNENISIGNSRTETVGKDEKISIGENRTEDVGKEERIGIGASRTTNVAKNENLTIGENRQEQVGKNEEIQVEENRTHTIGKNDQLSVGKVLVVSAGDEITLKTGEASIVMKKDGSIEIKGKNINIEGSGKILVKASSDVAVKGSKVLNN